MKNKYLIFLIAPVVLLLGCSTHYVKMKNYLSSPPYGISDKEFKDEFGKMPVKIDHFSDVTRMTYKTFRGGYLEDANFWAYFRDNRLIRISEEDYPLGAFTELNDLVAIGVISKEEYQWRHQQLSQRALSALQIMASMPPLSSYPMPFYQSSSQPEQEKYTIYGVTRKDGNIHYGLTGYIEGDTIYGTTKRDGNIHYGPVGYIEKEK